MRTKSIKNKPDEIPEVQMRSFTIRSIVTHKRTGYRTEKQTVTPFIRITGKWLEQAGFKPDERISVMVSKNLLVIKPEEQ